MMQKSDIKNWFVYILSCNDGSLYTGITTELNRRLRQHNGELAGGAKYTSCRRPVSLLWNKKCENRTIAAQEEYAIKQLSQQEKLRYIK